MAGYKIVSIVATILTVASVTSAAGTRINDDLTFNEETGHVMFDPIKGLNETTKSPEWQRQYLESLDETELIARHYEERDLHMAFLDPRAPDPANIRCWRCMASYLNIFTDKSKQYAFDVCYQKCAQTTARGIANNAPSYAAAAGFAWQAGAAWYDTWVRTPMNL